MPPTEEDLAWFRSTFHPIPKAALPDDCVEYSLYIINSDLDALNDSEARLKFREVQQNASELQKEWLKDYIWQRQGFSLELTKEDGMSLLRGRTEYGDSVEDEWVVVWLLREISKKFQNLWIKVTDNDGEFLLIEASGTIPAWLEPEVAENRVWINDGGLTIIKPASAARSSKRTDETLSLKDARNVISSDKKRLMRSSIIEEEAFYRIRDYPSKIDQNTHHTLMTLPRKIAFLLNQKPAYIAPATEAFYLRDPIALKPLQSAKNDVQLIFPPNDLVTFSVRLPRIGYAQIKSQEFPPPLPWKAALPPKGDSQAYLQAESGMKLSCGFEMLLSDPQHQDKPAVREMKMLLEDVDTGDEKYPTDEEIKEWDIREDDESWLDISFDDLEAELGGNKKGKAKVPESSKKAEFGDKAAQENLRRIVKQFESFLGDDKAGPDGAGMFDEESDDDSDDSDDDAEDDSGEDKDASFDEDEFTKMMREMMGMPAEVMNELLPGQGRRGDIGTKKKATSGDPNTAKGKLRPEEADSSEEEPSEEDLQKFMEQIEAELKQNGALNLDAGTSKVGATRRAIKGTELTSTADNKFGEDSDDGEEDEIDINLARNLLESFKSQAGMAGPGGNMMGMMGLGLPRDEDDGNGNGRSKQS